MEKEDKWRILDNTHEWVKFADAKASLIVTANIFIISVSLRTLPEWSKKNDNSLFFWLCFMGICTSAISFAMSIVAISPKIKSKVGNSKLYFKDISNSYSRNKNKNYEADLNKLSSKNVNLEISSQILNVSGVASRKFRYIKASIYILALSFCFLFSAFLIRKLES